MKFSSSHREPNSPPALEIGRELTTPTDWSPLQDRGFKTTRALPLPHTIDTTLETLITYSQTHYVLPEPERVQLKLSLEYHGLLTAQTTAKNLDLTQAQFDRLLSPLPVTLGEDPAIVHLREENIRGKHFLDRAKWREILNAFPPPLELSKTIQPRISQTGSIEIVHPGSETSFKKVTFECNETLSSEQSLQIRHWCEVRKKDLKSYGAKAGSSVKVELYYHNDPFNRFDNNFRIDVHVNKHEYVALLPKEPLNRPLTFSDLELIPKDEYIASCGKMPAIRQTILNGEPLTVEDATLYVERLDHKNRAHFVPGKNYIAHE